MYGYGPATSDVLGDPDPVLSLSVDSRTVAQLDPWKHAKFANLKGPPYAQ